MDRIAPGENYRRRPPPPRARSTADAGLAVVLREQSSWEPLDEAPASRHLAVRTERPMEQITADVPALLDRRLVDFA